MSPYQHAKPKYRWIPLRIVPQTAASLNTSLTPAKSPQFAQNMSKLVELGLGGDTSISWTTGASGNAIGVRMYILEFSFPFYVIFKLHDHVPRAH